MNDQFGFPRHAETIAAGGFAGAPWKVFWSLSNLTVGAVGIQTYACPYPFPGRYFRLGKSFGSPNVTVATFSPGMMPLVRLSAAVATTGTYTLNGALSRDLTASPLSITIGPAGGAAGSMGMGYLAYNVAGQLTAVYSALDDGGVNTTAQVTMTYGGQDIWFYAKIPTAGNLVALCIEYIDIPL